MHILCPICSDLVNPAENLYVTKCGHLFHYHCLAQWIERSKSCPQCRNKVTDRCMFRIYPTVSNENSGEDAATLQSRLDDAMLKLRTQKTEQKELKDKLAAATQEANKKEELLKATEKRLVSRDSAVAGLREQLEYVKVQGAQAQLLREENDALKKNLQTLNGLQKVLNATAGEVEETLRGYSDLRTLATFAAALKRALCESEAKKRSCRELQHGAEQRLAAMRARYEDLQANLRQVQENLTNMERKYEALKHKRKASGDAEPRGAKLARPAPAPAPSSAPAPAPAPASSPAPASAGDSTRLCSSLNDATIEEKDVSFGTAVQRIVRSDSPYLSLKQSGLALGAVPPRRPAPAPAHLKVRDDPRHSRHQRKLKEELLSDVPTQQSSFKLVDLQSALALCPQPSELLFLSSAPTSIFHGPPLALNTAFAEPPDGLGGRSRADVFPPPRPRLPHVTGKHKLKRLPSAGSRDISLMFAGLRDKH